MGKDDAWSYLASAAENFKNGMTFSGKYMSAQKNFAPPHVVFFANFPPPDGLWSEDRLKETVLTEADKFHAATVPLSPFAPGPVPTEEKKHEGVLFATKSNHEVVWFGVASMNPVVRLQ
jgi:hypothetical protein